MIKKVSLLEEAVSGHCSYYSSFIFWCKVISIMITIIILISKPNPHNHIPYNNHQAWNREPLPVDSLGLSI